MLERIEKNLARLSASEKRVARWVMEHPRRAASATLAEIAEACDTSQPTVIRFCRSVGAAGFRDFVLRLTEDLSRATRYVYRDVTADDSPQDVATKIIDSAVRTLLEQRQWLQDADVSGAAGRLAGARQIVFAGVGGSGHVAADACHKFFRLGIPCTSLVDISSILQHAAVASADSVFVFISNSGRWPSLREATALLHDRGATAIALTDPDTSLAQAADIVLPCTRHEDTGLYTPMNSRLAQLAVLDVLQVATALVLGDAAAQNLQRSKQALEAGAAG